MTHTFSSDNAHMPPQRHTKKNNQRAAPDEVDPKKAPLRGHVVESHRARKGMPCYVQLVVRAVHIVAFDGVANYCKQEWKPSGYGFRPGIFRSNIVNRTVELADKIT